jgi:cell wall-associated NlpC family hydrolase
MFAGNAEEISAMRKAVVKEALEWCSTPYHHGTGIKGIGCDCAQLLIRVFCDLGLVEPFKPDAYAPQWFLHRDEPRYLQWVERYARRVEWPGEAGDIYLFNFGRHPAHGGIAIEPGRSMVHAYGPLKRVLSDDPQRFSSRLHSTWSVFA